MSNRNLKAISCRYILLCLIAGLGFWTPSSGQTVVFLETFSNTGIGLCDQGTDAHGFTTANGSWTVTQGSSNDSAANKWYISATEPGLAPGACATPGCYAAPQYTDRTLHIGNVPNSPNASTICATGDCGAIYDAGSAANAVQTDTRVESPSFSLQANKYYMVSFNYLEFGDGASNIDNMLMEFFDGSTWYPSVADAPRTQNPCGAGSYRWEKYSGQLPPILVSMPAAKIGFTWTNDNGGPSVTTPSIAIDSISIIELLPPVANITASDTDICVNICVNFQADSAGPGATYDWTFNGASTPTSTLQNPTGICYPNPGSYDVQLVVINAAGSDTANMVMVVNPCAAPVADFIASDSVFCERSTINFTDLSTQGPTQWIWSFPGGVPPSSNSPTPPPINYPNPGSYSVTLIVFNQYGSDTLTKLNYLQVDTCPFPIADFNYTTTMQCPQYCVTFTDNSQYGPILTYDWYFPGATPDTSSSATPTVCYDRDGQYDAQLIVTNQYGPDTIYKYSVANVSFIPNAWVSPDTSLRFGESYQINSSGGIDFQWTPSTGLDYDTTASPIATPKTTTTYTVQITDAMGCVAYRQVTITVLQDNNLFIPNSFSPNGDGANEKVYVRGNNLYGVRLTIFDRWGEKVFETTNQSEGWDGTYNGKELDPAVFTYVVTVNFNNKESITRSGTITLIR